MKKIDLLYLTTDSKIGGAENIILALIKGLNRNKYSVGLLILSGTGPLIGEAKKLGIEVTALRMKSKFDIISLLKIFPYLRKKKIDILHTHLYHSNIIGALVKKWKRIPIFLYTSHGLPIEKNSPLSLCNNLIMRKANHKIIAVSSDVKRKLINYGKVKPEKIILIHNGIDVSKFFSSEKGKDILIGTIANLRLVKGHQYLLKAIPTVLEGIPSTKFLIVGQGPLRKDLEQLAKRLKITKNVIFTGYQKNIAEILAKLTLFVLPSIREPLGICLLEAMATGLPVVATNIGGIPEVVKDRETGLLVPPKNPEILAHAILTLLQNREKAKNMAIAGRRRVEEKFNLKIMVRKTEEVYQNLIGKNFLKDENF